MRESAEQNHSFFGGRAIVCLGDAAELYSSWDRPTVIVADGPYGLGSFPGEMHSPDDLAEWYEPHAKAWYDRALPHRREGARIAAIARGQEVVGSVPMLPHDVAVDAIVTEAGWVDL